MGVNISTNQKKNITVLTEPKNTIQIKTSGDGGSGGVNKLSLLSDVDATDVNDKETLVYDAATGKYVIKQLPIVDAGEF